MGRPLSLEATSRGDQGDRVLPSDALTIVSGQTLKCRPLTRPGADTKCRPALDDVNPNYHNELNRLRAQSDWLPLLCCSMNSNVFP